MAPSANIGLVANGIHRLLLKSRGIISPTCDARISWRVADVGKGGVCHQREVMDISIWVGFGCARTVIGMCDEPDLNSRADISH